MKIALVFILMIFYSCAYSGLFKKTPILDTQMSAIEGGDYTALVEGCGNQLVPGYTYCRKYEGTSSDEEIFFVGPITNCKREFCVEFKIYQPDGSAPIGDSIPKKENRKSVKWSRILRRDTFENGDTGFWPFNYKVYWIDKNGRENFSISQGEIRLRVLKKEYIPLNEVVNDFNFTWNILTRNNETIKMTTGMRAYVSRRK